ncbi:MAG TPA: CvpA family protein [Firmicutes bacterium]|nr:CvpA family protein [Bacillota bacterium]
MNLDLVFLDWAIIITLLIFTYRGFRHGFVQQFLSIIGSVVAVIAAFYFYGKLGMILAAWLRISENLAGILGFILIVIIISAAVGLSGKKWKKATDNSSISTLDGIFGALFGALKVLIVWVLILLLLSSLPWDFIQTPLLESTLARDVLKLAPCFYFLQEKALPADVPRLYLTPEGLQFRKLRYEDLDGSTCIACGGEVRYLGPAKQGLFYFPLFQCSVCERRSDGCQTFEGFHLYYGRCPWEARTFPDGTKCEIWSDQPPVYPARICPVCGQSNVSSF